MSTRIISWQSVVTQADPSFYYSRQHLLRDEFSNGRLFYSPVGNIYQAYVPMTDEAGNPVESDIWHRILETDSINPNTLMPGAALVHAAGSASPPPDVSGPSPYTAYVPMTNSYGDPILSDVWGDTLETDSINPHDLWAQNQLVHGNGKP